jgi:hypothetical protein
MSKRTLRQGRRGTPKLKQIRNKMRAAAEKVYGIIDHIFAWNLGEFYEY